MTYSAIRRRAWDLLQYYIDECVYMSASNPVMIVILEHPSYVLLMLGELV